MDTITLEFSRVLTLNEGKSHPNCYQTVELSGLCHPTKLERTQSVNVCIQANVKFVYLFVCL